MAEMEDVAFRGAPESVVSVDCSRAESADTQSDQSEDVPTPVPTSQPVLHEDPLVLNSPRISIPKKQQAVFKRSQWPHLRKFPNVSGDLFIDNTSEAFDRRGDINSLLLIDQEKSDQVCVLNHMVWICRHILDHMENENQQ